MVGKLRKRFKKNKKPNRTASEGHKGAGVVFRGKQRAVNSLTGLTRCSAKLCLGSKKVKHQSCR